MQMEQLGKAVAQLTEDIEGTWSIVLEDLNTGDVWAQNEQTVHYAASIIKVPIMATVYRLAGEGKLRLSDVIEVKKEDLVGGAGVLQHLTPGPFSIADLVMLMIIQSDNTATNVLIDYVTVPEVQETMYAVPMEYSSFYNKLMIVPTVLEGYNQISAIDIAILLKMIVSGKFSSVYACEQMVEVMKKQQIHYITEGLPEPSSAMIGGLPKWEFASKTGNVTGVRHDVGIFYVGERAMVVTILSSECEKNLALQTLNEIGVLLYQYMTQNE